MAQQFHVLAVEDEDADARFIERVGGQNPLAATFRVLSSAEEAQRYLAGQEPYSDRARNPLPNLVLLDLKLRGVTGLQLLRWIRQSPAFRSLSVVVLSGTTNPSDLNRAYELGIDAYIMKPVDLKIFAATLTGVLVSLVGTPSSGSGLPPGLSA